MDVVTDAMISAALNAPVPDGQTVSEWIAIPTEADLEEFGIDSRHYAIDAVRGQQLRQHAERVIVPAIQAALESLSARNAELEKALEPFAEVGRVIDYGFGEALFPDAGTAFANETGGCVWVIDGNDRRLSWSDFRRAREALRANP